MLCTPKLKESVKNILDDFGLSYLWHENSINIHWLKMKVLNILIDQFKQSWYSDVQNSPKIIEFVNNILVMKLKMNSTTCLTILIFV